MIMVWHRKSEVSFKEGSSRLDRLRINTEHQKYRDFLAGYRRYDPDKCDIREAELLPEVSD